MPGYSVRRPGPGDERLLECRGRDAADFYLAGRGESEAPLSPAEAGEFLCHVPRTPSGTGPELLLYAVGVRRAHRRCGVGSALLRTMFDWATTEGIAWVWVLADNPGAQRFYASSGFRVGEPGEQGVLMLREVVPDDAVEPSAAEG